MEGYTAEIEEKMQRFFGWLSEKEVVYSNSADNSNRSKTGYNAPSQHMLEGATPWCRIIFCLSARPVRPHLALCHVTPLPAQARGDGSGCTRRTPADPA